MMSGLLGGGSSTMAGDKVADVEGGRRPLLMLPTITASLFFACRNGPIMNHAQRDVAGTP
jgi:hypothetical protein